MDSVNRARTNPSSTKQGSANPAGACAKLVLPKIMKAGFLSQLPLQPPVSSPELGWTSGSSRRSDVLYFFGPVTIRSMTNGRMTTDTLTIGPMTIGFPTMGLATFGPMTSNPQRTDDPTTDDPTICLRQHQVL